MNILTVNNFIATTGTNLPSALNLKNGAVVIGKVLSVDASQILLDIAGQQVSVKAETSPGLTVGSVLHFQINTNASGSVELQLLPEHSPAGGHNVSPQAETDTAFVSLLKQNAVSIQSNDLQKLGSLLQQIQNHSKSPIAKEILAFITANQWPVTSGTLLISWLYRDSGARNLLYNLLHTVAQENPSVNPLTTPIINMLTENEGVFKELIQQINQEQTQPTVMKETGSEPPQSNLLKNMSILQEQDGSTRIEMFLATGKTSTIKLTDKECEQIRQVLQNNTELVHIKLSGDSHNANVIPLLVRDLYGELHEILLEWKEKKSGPAENEKPPQWLQMIVPTENLGEVHVTLKISEEQIKANLKVDSAGIRQYLSEFSGELTRELGLNTAVSISLTMHHPMKKAGGVDVRL